MQYKTVRWLLLVGVLVSSPLMSTCAAAPPRPHIIFILADDLGWGDVGYHGSRIATPNIDRLAAEGTRLEQFYVQSVCSPTRAALLTGRYPMRLGLQCGVVRPWADYGLPAAERTLPEALRDAGYLTAIVGKWHLGHCQPDLLPTRRGFAHQYGHYNGMLDYFTHQREGGHDWHRDDRAAYDEGYTTHLIAREAARVIADHDPAQPLFLYVAFNAPHTPLQVPDRYVTPYAAIEDEDRRRFAGMVTAMDEGVGRIAAALVDHDYPPVRTLVVFCSDNGGIPRYGSNGPFRAGKGRLYEGGVRVPALMHMPGVVPSSRVVDEPLHMVDMFPTLVHLAGGATEGGQPLDGRDAWATITAAAPTPHDVIVHNVTPFDGAIRVGDWKLVHNGHVGAMAAEPPPTERWELFNTRMDPGEEHNQADAHPEVLARLQQQLATLATEAVEPRIAPSRPPRGFVTPKVWGRSAD
ncbi:MAG: arylsulfatase [Pirellulales bacterium]